MAINRYYVGQPIQMQSQYVPTEIPWDYLIQAGQAKQMKYDKQNAQEQAAKNELLARQGLSYVEDLDQNKYAVDDANKVKAIQGFVNAEAEKFAQSTANGDKGSATYIAQYKDFQRRMQPYLNELDKYHKNYNTYQELNKTRQEYKDYGADSTTGYYFNRAVRDYADPSRSSVIELNPEYQRIDRYDYNKEMDSAMNHMKAFVTKTEGSDGQGYLNSVEREKLTQQRLAEGFKTWFEGNSALQNYLNLEAENKLMRGEISDKNAWITQRANQLQRDAMVRFEQNKYKQDKSADSTWQWNQENPMVDGIIGMKGAEKLNGDVTGWLSGFPQAQAVKAKQMVDGSIKTIQDLNQKIQYAEANPNSVDARTLAGWKHARDLAKNDLANYDKNANVYISKHEPNLNKNLSKYGITSKEAFDPTFQRMYALAANGSTEGLDYMAKNYGNTEFGKAAGEALVYIQNAQKELLAKGRKQGDEGFEYWNGAATNNAGKLFADKTKGAKEAVVNFKNNLADYAMAPSEDATVQYKGITFAKSSDKDRFPQEINQVLANIKTMPEGYIVSVRNADGTWSNINSNQIPDFTNLSVNTDGTYTARAKQEKGAFGANFNQYVEYSIKPATEETANYQKQTFDRVAKDDPNTGSYFKSVAQIERENPHLEKEFQRFTQANERVQTINLNINGSTVQVTLSKDPSGYGDFKWSASVGGNTINSSLRTAQSKEHMMNQLVDEIYNASKQ